MIHVLRDGLDSKHMQKKTAEYLLNRYSVVSARISNNGFTVTYCF